MKEINLRDYYPFYTQDVIVEVPDEVANLLREYKLAEAAYILRTYRHKAYFSLDYDAPDANAPTQSDHLPANAGRWLRPANLPGTPAEAGQAFQSPPSTWRISHDCDNNLKSALQSPRFPPPEWPDTEKQHHFLKRRVYWPKHCWGSGALPSISGFPRRQSRSPRPSLCSQRRAYPHEAGR